MWEVDQDELYRAAIAEHGAAIGRLLRAYEANAELRRDLLQDIHVGLWRSFAQFDRRCSLRTWVYRVAHNIASSHVARRMRAGKQVSLDALMELPDNRDVEETASEKQMLEKLTALIRTLGQPDRQGDWAQVDMCHNLAMPRTPNLGNGIGGARGIGAGVSPQIRNRGR